MRIHVVFCTQAISNAAMMADAPNNQPGAPESCFYCGIAGFVFKGNMHEGRPIACPACVDAGIDETPWKWGVTVTHGPTHNLRMVSVPIRVSCMMGSIKVNPHIVVVHVGVQLAETP